MSEREEEVRGVLARIVQVAQEAMTGHDDGASTDGLTEALWTCRQLAQEALEGLLRRPPKQQPSRSPE